MVCVVLEFCNEHAEALLAAPRNTRQLPSIKQTVQPNSEGGGVDHRRLIGYSGDVSSCRLLSE
jgi:hypothetical protein